MSERRAYKFRLKPTSEQAEALLRFAGARRFIYNWALERRQQTFKSTGKSVSWAALSLEVKIDRYFPSSKLCSVSGYKNESLRLADREWDCPDCGAHHQRDLNAARNLSAEGYRVLVAAGLSETKNARGADVRPATAGSLR